MSYFELYGSRGQEAVQSSTEPVHNRTSSTISPIHRNPIIIPPSRDSFDSTRPNIGLTSPSLSRSRLSTEIEKDSTKNGITAPPRLRVASYSSRREFGKPEIGEKDLRRSIDSSSIRKDFENSISTKNSLGGRVKVEVERINLEIVPDRPMKNWKRSRESTQESFLIDQHLTAEPISILEPTVPLQGITPSPPLSNLQPKVNESMEDIIQRYKLKASPRPRLSTSQSLPMRLNHSAPSPLTSPRPPSPPVKVKILSIDEIVAQHSKVETKGKYSPAQAFAATFASPRSRSGSVDSIEAEISESFDPSFGGMQRAHSETLFSATQTGAIPSAISNISREKELAILLNSTKFTQLITLKNGKIVSLSQVGEGFPVLVFLGLGSVRFLIGLYEEMALLLGLRLICIDRWGIGRTQNIPEHEKSFERWGAVVEEVMDTLKIEQFSILAHSLGAAFACGSLPRVSKRIIGSVHLLAPWVIRKDSNFDSLNGNFKLLRFLPVSVVSAVAAVDWKLKGIALGKAPSLVHEPVGYTKKSDLKTSTSSSNGSFLTELFGGSTRSLYKFDSESNQSIKKPSMETKRNSLLANSISDSSPTRSSFQFKRSYDSSNSIRSSSRPTNSRTSSTSSISNFSKTPQISGLELATALLQKSHEESYYSSLELAIVLEKKNSIKFNIDYELIKNPLKVWIGMEDERISMTSIDWLNSQVEVCNVITCKGADHSLMTNSAVMIEVLESISAELTLI